eukprot:3045230-Rhodomonas_salina.2
MFIHTAGKRNFLANLLARAQSRFQTPRTAQHRQRARKRRHTDVTSSSSSSSSSPSPSSSSPHLGTDRDGELDLCEVRLDRAHVSWYPHTPRQFRPAPRSLVYVRTGHDSSVRRSIP